MVGKKIAPYLTLRNAFIGLGIVAVVLGCVPYWWLFAGWAEMKTWYPSMGGLVFIAKTALLIAFCMLSVGTLSIVFRNRRTIQEVFGNLPGHKKRGLTALGVSIMMYTLYTLLGDVFVEWMYSPDPHTMDVSQVYLLLHTLSLDCHSLRNNGGMSVSIWVEKKME